MPTHSTQIITASVVLFSDIIADNPRLDTPIDPTDFTRLRFVVIMQNNDGEDRRLRLLQWNDGNLDFYRNMDKSSSTSLGGPGSGWDSTLIDSVWSDDPQVLEEKLTGGKKST